MAEPLQRMSDLFNEQNNPVAKAQEVVLKGFDGSSYPVLKVNEQGELVQERPISSEFTQVNPDGTPAQKVEVYADKTVTTDYVWVNGLPNKTITIT